MTTAPVPERLAAALADRYRIEGPVGQGGMATVYLAADLKHDRQVAIKVLKPELAAVIGGDRFVTEIKTTAALQHPHILPLFDSGEADGFLYYVMPFVDGESLRDRLDREKQLGVEASVRLVRAVASALHYAHERGIVHRDIKPANILIHAGEPVVADFGIALAISAAGGGRLTETGLSVGTPHYMSPEQAGADRDVDARSDVYSLACVLYELLAGQPPHPGPTARAVLMKILTEEPDAVTEHRKSVPPGVAAALAHALEKLPADRFESADAFARALGDPGYRYGDEVGGRAAGAGSERGWGGWQLAGVGAALLAGALLGRALVDAPVPVPVHATLESGTPALEVAAAPDGSVAYSTTWSEGRSYRRYLDRPGSAVLRDAPGGLGVFSPDGQWYVFFESDGSSSRIGRMPAAGGPETDIWSSEGSGLDLVTPADWTAEGWIYAIEWTSLTRSVVLRMREDGSGLERLADLPTARTVSVLPGDRGAMLALARSAAVYDTTRIVALDFESGDTVPVLPVGAHPTWSPTGHVIYMAPSSELFALPFDPAAMEARGAPVPLGIRTGRWNAGFRRFDLLQDGTLVYLFDEAEQEWGDSYELVDAETGERETVASGPSVGRARISPDGGYLAITALDDLVIEHLGRGATREIRLDDATLTSFTSPLWFPAGDSLLVTADDGLWVVDRDSGGSRRAVDGTIHLHAMGWLPTGEVLTQSTNFARTEADIGAADLETGTVRPLLDAPNFMEAVPRLSPDGRWLAYLSNRTGAFEVYVRDYPGLAEETTVSVPADSVDSNTTLEWGGAGDRLVFTTGGSWANGRPAHLVAARIDPAGAAPRVVGRDTIPGEAGSLSGVAGDGRLVHRIRGDWGDAEAGTDIRVVTDFLERLRRLGGGR